MGSVKFRDLKLAALVFFSSQLFATNIGLNTPLCPEATLQQYMNTYGTGIFGGSCAIGNLVYNQFSFAALPVASNGSETVFGTISASDIIIRPDASRSAFDYFPIASKPNLFNRSVNPNEAERYFFSYSADPPPIIAGDELFLDPPTGPVYGTKWICADQNFAPPPGGQSFAVYASSLNRASYDGNTFGCSGPAKPAYIIKTDGDPSTTDVTVKDKVIFDLPASVINVIILLDYEAGNNETGRNVTGFDGVQTPVILTVPEPANVFLMGSSLIALLAMMRRRKV